MFKVINHNGTLLGTFKTHARAQREAAYYEDQTGNKARVINVAAANYARMLQEAK